MLTDDVDVPDAYQNTLCPTIASNDEMSRRSVFDDSKVLCYIHAINLNPFTLHLYTFLEINCICLQEANSTLLHCKYSALAQRRNQNRKT